MTSNVVDTAVQAFAWWDLVPAVVGGVIGALAGGIPAYLIAKSQAERERDRHIEVARDADHVHVFRVYKKLSDIANCAVSTLLQIDEMMKRPTFPGDESPVQRKISAFSNFSLSDAPLFEADELSVFLRVNDMDYMTSVDLLGRRHRSFIEGMMAFAERKKLLHELMGQSDQIKFGEDDVIYTNATGPTAIKLRLEARTIETLIVPLITQLEENAKMAVLLASKYGSTFKAYFHDKPVPNFDFSELKSVRPNLLPETGSPI